MIQIKGLSKRFIVFRNNRAKLRYALGLAQVERDYHQVESLKNLNLEIKEGEVHGIIGMNGAGKSTLLKILTGVLMPTNGSFTIDGRVAALLELGTGFHGDLTGEENILLNAELMGLPKGMVESKLPEIREFAELGDFFDYPVRVYSSGMYVRLAFAFMSAIQPQVLIIDEALSVGDAYFQQKSLARIADFKNQGATILFVSHDIAAVRKLCDRVSLLRKGELVFTGPSVDAIERYNALLADHSLATMREGDSGQGLRSGDGQMEIAEVILLDNKGSPVRAVSVGETLQIAVTTKVNRALNHPTCGILIRDRLGNDVFGTNTAFLGIEEIDFTAGDTPRYLFSMPLNLGPGEYTLTVALHSGDQHLDENFDWLDRAVLFQVLPRSGCASIGIAHLQTTVSVDKGMKGEVASLN